MQWGARIVTSPANGTVTIDSSGVAHYKANAAFSGSDSFTYVAADNAGGESAPATVTVTVTGQSGSTPSGNTPPGNTPRSGGGGSMDWLLLIGLAMLTMLAQCASRSKV
ncbi:hypothetical protein GCM10011487_60970 [Steroidobacter agaridevorans]|uniref:Uncharacterized protein n=1 Tax=Steroidobacter agaridevorans TaxID=2695856 RepID=A0A829YL49_9GAMM|nr:Ig-like domain-containing protein [Steroidobacter agaridevorans]GFE84097.1 hypothetical protein GCM10011487_60970 [Steroidobacter agaridevorans]GFE86917.1 hypothetical protein GCM10011488_18710 [Steroidobacter agaridevorans]